MMGAQRFSPRQKLPQKLPRGRLLIRHYGLGATGWEDNLNLLQAVKQ